jgi:hypothetical protein
MNTFTVNRKSIWSLVIILTALLVAAYLISKTASVPQALAATGSTFHTDGWNALQGGCGGFFSELACGGTLQSVLEDGNPGGCNANNKPNTFIERYSMNDPTPAAGDEYVCDGLNVCCASPAMSGTAIDCVKFCGDLGYTTAACSLGQINCFNEPHQVAACTCTAPPGTKTVGWIEVAADDGMINECIVVNLIVKGNDGLSMNAPKDLLVRLYDDSPTGKWYMNSTCQTEAITATIAQGTMQKTLYFRETDPAKSQSSDLVQAGYTGLSPTGIDRIFFIQ